MAEREWSWSGILIRIAIGIALVLLTFNPARLSYYHWALTDLATFSPLKAVPGAILLCGWVLYLRAAIASLGWLGLVLSSIVVASIVWLLSDLGWIETSGARPLAWISLVAIGFILGLGLSWSIVRRRITGQIDVDNVERR